MKILPRWFTATLAVGVITAEMFIPVSRVNAQLRPAQEQTIPDFDSRAAVAEKSGAAALRMQGEAHLKSELPSATVSYDPLLGTPKFIRAQDGFLTGPNGQGRAVSAATAQALPPNDPYLSVKAFLNEHSALFNHGADILAGATVSREDVGAHSGLRTVVWQQRLDGIPIFESVLIGNITRNGELVTLSSQFLPNPAQSADAGTPNRQALQNQPSVSAEQAIIDAAQNLGDSLAAGAIVSSTAPNESSYQMYDSPKGKIHIRLVWLPMNRDTMRLCWEVLLFSQTTHYRFQVLVAADTGQVLLRRNLTEHISNATYNVYTSDSPSPFSPGWPTPNPAQPPLTSRTMVTIAALSTNASPNGWINDADNTTTGNNADAYVDRNFDQQPDGPRPVGNPNRVFDFPLDLTQAPLTYSNASTVQMFYWLNVYHDKLYELGFTESAGNYQIDNFGRGGLGNDNIICYIQAGADVGQANNAFFAFAPDGVNGQIAMFVWDGPNPDRDGDIDAEVILHEATHGTSGRLVGGGVGISALQTGGMGEGWSDFYGLSLLSQPGDDVNGNYAMVGYATYQIFGIPIANYYFGIRHYPYTTDMSKNPFTFKNIDPTQASVPGNVPLSPLFSPYDPSQADEVHNSGEIWCVTLWDVRANLVSKYGYAGNQTMLQIVTDGMKLGPANPNFLQARDAIILADQVDNGGANYLEIWKGFAKRGMGISATSPDSSTTIGVHEAFDVPGVQISGTNLPAGNGNGVIDPNECNTLFLVLTNLGGVGATNILTTITTTNEHVIVTGRQSPYPNLPPGAGSTNLVAFQFSTSASFICGTPVNFALVIKCDQFTQTNYFTVSSGLPGTPVRYDGLGGVSIPDLSSGDSPVVVSGFTSPLLKATVSLFITHTYDSDLLLQLISPDGITNVLANRVGGSADNFGSSCAEASRTVFDDAASVNIGVGAAPFIGSFKPAQPLSVYIGRTGTNVNGTWHLHVVDQVGIDFGTIQCWSLSLTPSVCTDGGGECPGSDLAIAGSAVPEPLIIGGNLVYTISVTNRGPKTAKGVTLTQLLPPSVVFGSANISQGSISYSGGVVSGNIGNMAAGAVVTATVTVQPALSGTITSTASAAAVSDPDPDPSNNSVNITSHINPPTSDMTISIAGSPNPVLVGGTLTYTIYVTNNGPSAATGVVASNALPATVALTSATPSQGSSTILGNVVLFNFGGLDVGAVASATITVIPSAQGLITANAAVVANQFDPVSGNNRASVTTSVSPSADLAVGFQNVPASIILGNNLSYTINATNLGPSTATSVQISQTLPVGATVVSSNSTLGTVLSQSGNTMNCSVGSLGLGATVSMTVVVSISSTGNVSSTATISGALADANSANNSATVNTLVATPFVGIQVAGATLTAESFVPANGAIEPGETVTVQLRLANVGNIPTTNLMAKLLATNGVTAPSAATQTYGALAPGGFPVPKSFSFTASGTNGGVIIATLQLSGDVSNKIGFTFVMPKAASFANTNVIVIPDIGSGSPYPSTLDVSGVTGLVGKVTATLSNFNHSYPHDVSVLLVSPFGASTLLMSHTAEFSTAAGADLTFDDSASTPLPASGSVASGSWQPSAYAPDPVFITNAPPATNPPAGPYPASMSLFNGSNPNGTWLLYVMDDSGGDGGGISNGWSLAITTITPVNQVADLSVAGVSLPHPVQAGSNFTNTFTVTNNGTNSANAVAFTNLLPANVNLLWASASQGSLNTNNAGKVVVNLGSLAVGASASVVVVMSPTASGSLSCTANVSAVETDLVPGNNLVTLANTANLPVADVSLSQAAAPNPVVTSSNLVYAISVTNNGPGTALNVVVTDPLSANLTFLSSSAGSFAAGTFTCNLGNLASGAGAVIYVTNRAVTVGTLTNTATATTGSSDSNLVNNSASVSVIIRAPSANIIATSAKLLSESFTPPDGVVDPGETVSVSLSLANAGEIDTTSLVATLLNTGGVTGSSGSQNYGAVVNNGPAVSRTFSFTASPSASGVVTATLQLQDGASNLGTVTFNFALPQTNSFTNSGAILIPDHGSGAPYPSTINVSGLAGVVSKVTVTLNGVTHSFPHDIGVLLVSPSGAKSVVMSGAGGGSSISNLNLSFDDAAASTLSDSAQIVAGTYKPTDNPPGKTFPTPAPAGAATNVFARFNGTAPNGVWSLYVVDNAVGDSGVIAGGWSFVLTTVSPINSAADLYISASGGPSPVYVGGTVTYNFVVTNKGLSLATAVVVSNTLPAGSTLGTVTHSQGTHSSGSGMVIFNVGNLGVNAIATLSVAVNAGVAGSAEDTASVSANEADLYLADNSASASVSVISIISPELSGAIVKTNQFQITLIGQPGFTYIIQGSTNLTSWSSISTNTAAGNGILTFTDTNASTLQQRYYRAVVVVP